MFGLMLVAQESVFKWQKNQLKSLRGEQRNALWELKQAREGLSLGHFLPLSARNIY